MGVKNNVILRKDNIKVYNIGRAKRLGAMKALKRLTSAQN